MTYKVSQQMAEAAATRPAVVGQALNEIAREDTEVLTSVLDVMEVEKLIESGAEIDVLPANAQVFVQLGGSPTPAAAVSFET